MEPDRSSTSNRFRRDGDWAFASMPLVTDSVPLRRSFADRHSVALASVAVPRSAIRQPSGSFGGSVIVRFAFASLPSVTGSGSIFDVRPGTAGDTASEGRTGPLYPGR